VDASGSYIESKFSNLVEVVKKMRKSGRDRGTRRKGEVSLQVFVMQWPPLQSDKWRQDGNLKWMLVEQRTEIPIPWAPRSPRPRTLDPSVTTMTSTCEGDQHKIVSCEALLTNFRDWS
jgi:hypothetical protein